MGSAAVKIRDKKSQKRYLSEKEVKDIFGL
jgi:hypothetical protein